MKRLSRRAFLATSTSLAGTLALAGLPAFAVTPKESTSLQAQVDAGELPPIDERLPENPLVITPTDRPGQQGGDWNHALVGGGSLSMVVRYQGYEPLVRFTPDWSGIEPNVAESPTRSTPTARSTPSSSARAMKWSDGEPFTTEDVQLLVRGHTSLDPDDRSRRADLLDHPAARRPSSRSSTSRPSRSSSPRPNGFFLQSLAWAQPGPDGARAGALPQAVPHQVQPGRRRRWPRSAASRAGSRSSSARQASTRTTSSSRTPKRPTLNAWKFEIAPGRGHRAGDRGAQPLLLQGRHRGDAAPLLRPHRLPDGRRSARSCC